MVTLLLDGNNLAYRAKYSFSKTHRQQDVGVVYGFLYVLFSYIDRYSADSIIVCWDGGTPPDRREKVASYKSNRTKDDDIHLFFEQIDILRRVLSSMGILNVREKGLEADDLIFHASRNLLGECIIISTDGDLAQSVTPDGRVQIYHPTSDKVVNWDNFIEHVGVSPERYLDYRVMTGDVSDNIKGIHGIGEQLAKEILGNYGSLNRALQVTTDDGPWDGSKIAKTRLLAANLEEIEAMREVMDLTADRYGCGQIIRSRAQGWSKYDHITIKRFLDSYGFFDLMLGAVRGNFEKLSAPEFLPEGMVRITITGVES